jgi:hypothetical protein
MLFLRMFSLINFESTVVNYRNVMRKLLYGLNSEANNIISGILTFS